MRALFSLIFRSLAWFIWVPTVLFTVLQVVGGNGGPWLIFLFFGAMVPTAFFIHYGQQLKYPAPPKKRPQRPAAPPPAPSPLPEAPPSPQGRQIATPPLAGPTTTMPEQVQAAMSPMLRQFITDGAEDIDGRK